jgi:hypothetical protein
VDFFLPLINNRHGYFVHYPDGGGLLDQPGTAMNILKVIQSAYFEYLKEANKIPGA